MKHNKKAHDTKIPPTGRYNQSCRKPNSFLNVYVFQVSLIVFCAFILIAALNLNSSLPEPFILKDSNSISNRFIAARAFKNLEQLSTIGPRVVGSHESEILAVEFLQREIRKVIVATRDLKRSNYIDYHVQQVSGCFGSWVHKCYHNVQNVVVKLRPKNVDNAENILLNCHFDTAPTSPGISDDGLHCAVMLEILRVLATAGSEEPLKKNVIFLFNGAEEFAFSGSHGFITQHHWANNIVCFINLESCGAGGREILFQTGPKANILPKLYANSVPHPYGNVIGEELFQSGQLPLSTDFSIFQNFGNLKGMDFAHFKNGYVYHTKDDNISFVSENVIQHTGDNILALLKALIAEENLKRELEERQEQTVFFDLFGYFMICYSITSALIINLLITLLSMVSLSYVTFRIFKGKELRSLIVHFVINFFAVCVAVLVTSLVLTVMAELMKWNGSAMLWYSNQWFAIAYYGVAALYTMTAVLLIRRYFIYSALNEEEEAQMLIIVLQLGNTVFLLYGSLLRIRSVYVLAIGLVGVSISHLLLNTVLRNESIGKKMIVYIVCNFIPIMYATYLAVQFFQLLIPIMGHIGMEIDSEMVMWILCAFFAFLIFSYLIPVVILVETCWKVHLSVGVCYLLFVMAVLVGSFLPPFQDETAERFILAHVNRKLARHGNSTKFQDSGFLLVPEDIRAPQTIKQIFRDEEFDVGKDSLQYVLPYFEHYYWSKTEMPPSFPETKELKFITVKNGSLKTFDFTLTGSALSYLTVLPLNNAKLISWKMYSNFSKKSTVSNRKRFLIVYIRGLAEPREWSFSLTFDTSYMKTKSYIFKLAWSVGHHSIATSHFTPNFQIVVDKFPSWTRAVTGVIDYEEYLFI